MNYASVINHFVPLTHQSSRQKIRKAESIIQLVFFMIVMVTIYIGVAIATRFTAAIFIFTVFLLISVSWLFFYKQSWPTDILYPLYIACCSAVIVSLIFYSGGFNSPIFHWLAISPILALLFWGLKGGVVFVTFIGIIDFVFYFYESFGYHFPQQIRIEYLQIIRLISIVGFAIFSFLMAYTFEAAKKINYQEFRDDIEKSERLLRNIMPASILQELKTNGKTEAIVFNEATVLISDFKGFTGISAHLNPDELMAEVNVCFSHFDTVMAQYGIEKIKTMGDSYLAVSGLPTPCSDHAEQAIHAAIAMQKFMKERQMECIALNRPYFEARIGLHTGSVIAGVVGISKLQYDIWGDTVNTASRLESSGEIGRINISAQTLKRVRHLFNFSYRGQLLAKGKGALDMYFLENPEI